MGSAADIVYEPHWVERDGTPHEIESGWAVAGNSANSSLALAPGADRLAISIVGSTGTDIWIKDLGTGTLSRLTFAGSGVINRRPSWRDGRSLVFRSNRQGTGEVLTQAADGSGSPTVIAVDANVYEGFYSPDSEWIVYRQGGGDSTDGDILAVRAGQEGEPVPLAADPQFGERSPALSPDGRWLAYESNESGQVEVYVRPFPNASDGRWLVSTGGGTEPVWSHSGRELFYRSGDDELVAVQVRQQAESGPPPPGTVRRGCSPRTGTWPGMDTDVRRQPRRSALRRATDQWRLERRHGAHHGGQLLRGAEEARPLGGAVPVRWTVEH